MTQEALNRKNRRALFGVAFAVVFMVGLSFAAVPLYSLFCQVTGFAGTTQRVTQSSDIILDREITVLFDSNVAPGIDWTFHPEQRSIDVKIGQDALVAFYARNDAAQPTAGTALFNVTPLKAGKYFSKVQCFCFGEQVLKPGEEVPMPVTFFVDPALAEDPEIDDVKTITLSYTFFATDTPALDRALEEFYNTGEADTDGDHAAAQTVGETIAN